MTKEEMGNILDIALERIFDDLKDVMEDEQSQVNFGERLAFSKFFTALQDAALICSIDLNGSELDFDVDKILYETAAIATGTNK